MSKSAKVIGQMVCLSLVVIGMYIFADHFGLLVYTADVTTRAFTEVMHFFSNLYTEFDTAPHKAASVAILLMVVGLLGFILLLRFFPPKNASEQ